MGKPHRRHVPWGVVVAAFAAFSVLTFASARPGLVELLSLPVFVVLGYLGLRWLLRRQTRDALSLIGRPGVGVFGALTPESAKTLMSEDTGVPDPAARPLDPVNGHRGALIANPGVMELWRVDMWDDEPHLARRWSVDEIRDMSPTSASYRGVPRTGIKVELVTRGSFVFVPINSIFGGAGSAAASIERLKAGLAARPDPATT